MTTDLSVTFLFGHLTLYVHMRQINPTIPPLGSGWLDICVDYFVRRDALINELEEIDIEEDLLLKVELDPQECC